MSFKVQVDDKRAFEAFDIIVKRWQAEPKQFPYDQKGAVIPQEILPVSLQSDTEALFNFYFYICLYMRGGIESLQAFNAMIRLWNDRPELFDPLYAQHLRHKEMVEVLKAYVGWDSQAVARYWIENSKRVVRNWKGRASNVFRGLTSYSEALRRIKNKTTKHEWKEACKVDDRGEGFMGFQPKMVSMFIYFIDWEGLLDKQFIYPTPADFHNFRFGLAQRIMTIVPQPTNLRSAEFLSKPWRDLTVRYLVKKKGKVSPVELADAIWLFSLTLCGNSPLTDFHEQTDKNGHGMFSPEDLLHSPVPNYLAPKFRGRLQRTCLACPLISRCSFAIPAKPYYQKRGERSTAFGGQLYLNRRFRIEDHLPIMEPARVINAVGVEGGHVNSQMSLFDL